MDSSCSELEFFDFSNAPEEEIIEIRDILKCCRSNGFVELPWDIPCAEECDSVPIVTDQSISSEIDTAIEQKTVNAVVGQALLYTFPHPSASSTAVAHPQLPAPAPLQNPDVLPVEAFISPSGVQLPAVTTISHFPNAPPYVLPRTYPYVRTYPHLGVPLFTCTLSGSGEMRDLNPMQPPYGQFVPISAAVPQMDKHAEVKNDAEVRPKARGPLDKQFNRRNKKKHPSNNFYSTNMVTSDSFQESILSDDQLSVSLQGPIDINNDIPSVSSSVPLVPLPVPPSTFAVTSGAIPLHGYPPGLHTLPYPQISGPQTPSPVYYVPVFNHPHYASYIPSPTSGPMMLPMGVGNMHPVGDSNCNLEPVVAEDCGDPITSEIGEITDSLSLVPEKNTKSASNTDPDKKLEVSDENDEKIESSAMPPTPTSLVEKNIEDDNVPSSNSNTLHAAVSKLSIKDDLGEGHSKAEESREVYPDGTRCWADLFKKRCSEVNGLDQQLCTADNDSVNGHNLNKDCNGKLYSVPASDDLL